jgi:hypothetical protein
MVARSPRSKYENAPDPTGAGWPPDPVESGGRGPSARPWIGQNMGISERVANTPARFVSLSYRALNGSPIAQPKGESTNA